MITHCIEFPWEVHHLPTQLSQQYYVLPKISTVDDITLIMRNAVRISCRMKFKLYRKN